VGEVQLVNAGQDSSDPCAGVDSPLNSLALAPAGIQKVIPADPARKLHRKVDIALIHSGIEHPDHPRQPQGSKPLKFSAEAAGLLVIGVRADLEGGLHTAAIGRHPDIAVSTPTDAVLESPGAEL
jgi:hypothetical protein